MLVNIYLLTVTPKANFEFTMNIITVLESQHAEKDFGNTTKNNSAIFRT